MDNIEGFNKPDFRLGLVSYTSFNNNKPPKYLTDFVKGLDLKSNVFSFYSPLSNFLNASKSNSFP